MSTVDDNTVEPLYYGPSNSGHLRYTDTHRQSQTVSHRNVYLLIKDTSLFRNTDARSGPKQSYCTVNEFYNTVMVTPPSLIAGASAAVPHGLYEGG